MTKGSWKSITCKPRELAFSLNKEANIQKLSLLELKDGDVLAVFYAAKECEACKDGKVLDYDFAKEFMEREGRQVLFVGKSNCTICNSILKAFNELASDFMYKVRFVDVSVTENRVKAEKFGLTSDIEFLLVENAKIVGGGNQDLIVEQAFKGIDPREMDDRDRVLILFLRKFIDEYWGVEKEEELIKP